MQIIHARACVLLNMCTFFQILCYVMLFYAICYDICYDICYAMLCYVMLFCFVLVT